jgi:hypothetical protein
MPGTLSSLDTNLISHKYKSIFVHIPKCGGCSVEDVLRRNSHLPINQSKSSAFNVCLQHASLSEHLKYYKINKNMFSFTFVRNPWDRFVSYFFHLTRLNYLKTKVSFNEFAISMLSQNWARDYITPTCPTSNFMAPCSHWANDVDFIGRFENLQEDFNTVCSEIGIPQKELPHKNKTQHKHYTEYYNDEMKQIVEEKYARDIEQFGYEFGL